jgi:serine/threonine-protein kinase
MPIVGDLLAGRYRVSAALGAGGMASVWRARDERLDRDVAVKVLLPNLAADPLLALRFDREARALAAASHPAVVAIFDVEPGDPATGREPFYVMELCDGGSIAERLAVGLMSPDDAVPIVAAVAEGLTALHDRGIIHRDVKPANILVCGGRPKLADFGLARSEQSGAQTMVTVPGTIAGTLAYLAPECITGHPATTASDVYALGVVSFESLTGALPRAAGSIAELVEARHADPPQVSAIAPGLGTAFDAPIAAALALDPDARPDALGLAADLAAALGRWHRSTTAPARSGRRVAPAAPPAPVNAASALPVPTPPVDSAMHTVVVDRRSADRPRTDGAGGRPARPAGPGVRPGLVVLAAVAGTIVGLAALSTVLGGPSGKPTIAPSSSLAASSTPAATATPTPTPSPTPTPTATPTPSPTPTPTPTPDPAAPARAALDDVRAAIDNAREDGGLKRNEANDLGREADAIGIALRARDFDLARQRTDRLADHVDDLDGVEDDEHDALRAAVAALRAAIP